MNRLQRIESGLRATTSFDRQVEAVGGFVVAVSAGAAPGLAVAVPEQPESDLSAALAAVERSFERLGARPAIEYVDELHPRLAATAHARGWRTASVAPIMVLSWPPAVSAPVNGARVVWLTPDEAALTESFLVGQHAAFAGHGDALAWLPLLEAGLRSRTTRAAALEVDGRLVAGAAVQLGAGVGELVGVWTDRLERRRGHARSLCRALLRAAFEQGAELVWLSAAPDAAGLYRQLGFQREGTQRNLAGPGTPP